MSTRLNLPEECTAPLSRFREEGEEEAQDEAEEEADDEGNADADSEAGESEDEDDEISVEGQDEIDGRSTVTDRQSRVSSPDSSSDGWESDNDPRDHPLFFARIRKALPAKLCNICDC